MKNLTVLAILGLAAASVAAQPLDQPQTVFRQREQGLRLIQLSTTDSGTWLSEHAIMGLIKEKVPFMDITDHPFDVKRAVNEDKVPAKTAYQSETEQYLKGLDTSNMEGNLKTFTSFHNRYYKSSWGTKSCAWLLEKVTEYASPMGDLISVRPFKHSKWNQFSVIARFNGSNPALDNEAVIVSAHQDSMNMWLPDFGRAPGADDDGSGTVTILETFRTLVDNGFMPERPVEFHWYSAEEAGLLGSQEVAKKYKEEGREIVGQLQNDMTGYVGAHGEVIGIATDQDGVSLKLTEFIKQLVETYAEIPYVETACGYACSDHASWRKYGYASSFVMESAFADSNQYIHTWDDTIDKLSFDHMKQFARVAVGFAVEMSHERNN